MRRVAITGHRGLPADVRRPVEAEVRAYVDATRRHTAGGLVGLSCLADGADAIFARAVVDSGEALEVVVPAELYREGLPVAHHPVYDALLQRAALVHRLPFVESTAQAHMAAGRHMVDHCDELLAVWDGEPSRGHGGTADVVAYARERERAVVVIWPEGARR